MGSAEYAEEAPGNYRRGLAIDGASMPILFGKGRIACVVVLSFALVACVNTPVATTTPPNVTATSRSLAPTPAAAPTASATTAPMPARASPTTLAGSPVASPARPVASSSQGPSCAPGVDFLGFSDALDKTRFGDTAVGGLSALAYDPARGVYVALVDNQGDTAARFYTLRLPLAGGKPGMPQIEAVTILRDASGQPFTGRNFDGEGLTLLPNGELLISSETEPSIRRFAPDGRLLGALRVPLRFLVKPNGEATVNQTFESLGLTPAGQHLFTATEGPLATDGFTPDLRGRLRLIRYDRDAGGPDFVPAAQFFYLAEPAQGVADLVALSDSELLVLERGFIPGLGNTVRVFRVSLVGASDVAATARLSDPGAIPLKKELLVDLVNCPPSGAVAPARQPTPLLDNFEALALGPPLPDGRRLLLLLSDDNFGSDQVTRLIALAIP